MFPCVSIVKNLLNLGVIVTDNMYVSAVSLLIISNWMILSPEDIFLSIKCRQTFIHRISHDNRQLLQNIQGYYVPRFMCIAA